MLWILSLAKDPMEKASVSEASLWSDGGSYSQALDGGKVSGLKRCCVCRIKQSSVPCDYGRGGSAHGDRQRRGMFLGRR